MAASQRRLQQIAGELRTIAAGRATRDRGRIAAVLLHAHLHLGRGRRVLGWLPEPDPAPRTVRLRDGRVLLVRPQDAIVLFEHVGLGVYDIPQLFGDAAPRTIVDLGANVGFATVAFARRYPGARFVCVEPAAETRALLQENLARNAVQASVMAVGIAGRAGRLTLAAAHYAAADRLIESVEGEIEGIRLGELLDRAQVDVVDLLKVDIEGAERGLFADAGSWAPRVRTIVAELHDGFTAEAAGALLAPHGFEAIVLGDRVGVADLAAWRRHDARAPGQRPAPVA